MTLGMNCCCNCTWLNELFLRADTSGTDPSRLGSNWIADSAGSAQIVSNRLVISSANTVLKCNVSTSAAPAQFAVQVTGTVPSGTLFRIFPNSTNSGNHTRWTPNGTGTSHGRVVATQTVDLTNLTISNTGIFQMATSKNAAGNWMLSEQSSGGVCCNAVGAFSGGPAASTFTIETTTLPSPITISSIAAFDLNRSGCPGTADSIVPTFCDNATMSLTVSGYPSGNPANGTFVLGPTAAGCLSSQCNAFPQAGLGNITWLGGASLAMSQDGSGNTVLFALGSTTTIVTGPMGCVNGFGTIAFPTFVDPGTGNTISASLTWLGAG